MSRRKYLTLAGTTAGSVAIFSGSASADKDQYDTVKVGEGESRRFTVSDGETIENLLIDITNPDADAQIVARGSDWTIRNVGFQGSTDVGNFNGGFANLIKPSGDGTIEHCYLGDGVSEDGMRKGAIGPPSSHSGHLTIRNCYIAEWTDNGIYSAHAAQNGGGTVEIDGCYFRDNNVAQMRVASDGTVIKNTVAHNTGNVPELPGGTVHSKGIYTGYGSSSQKVEVHNCHFDQRDEITAGSDSAAAFVSTNHSSNGDCSTIMVSNTEFLGDTNGDYVKLASGNGNNPDTAVPDKTPTDAVAAARGDESISDSNSSIGTSSDDSSSKLPNTITISGGSATNLVEYKFTVSDDLEAQSGITGEDSINATTASGAVVGGSDTYAFAGDVTDFSTTGNIAVTINGESVNPNELGSGSNGSTDSTTDENSSSDSTDDENSSIEKLILIDGTEDPDNTARYRFSVTGTVEKDQESSTNNNGGLPWDKITDRVSDSKVIGIVGNGIDAYRFFGEITSIDINGNASYSVEEV